MGDIRGGAVGPGLVQVGDLRGGPRGLAFAADRDGTLLTAHEVVDGLTGVTLVYPGGTTVRVRAERIVPLPAYGLALIRADRSPPGGPWPLADGQGTRLVTLPGIAPALSGGISGLVTARYESSERIWLVPDVWLLSVEQAPYGLPVQAAGAPVVDAETGAAVGVATPALRTRRRGAVLAVPLGTVAHEPVVADLLARNAESVPGHGRALNLAGVLELAAATLGAAVVEAGVGRLPRPVGLPESAEGWDPVRPVLALVGETGSGRTTELAALALRRTRAAYRLPTVWLRGADLAAGDANVIDAIDRSLRRAHSILGCPAAAPLGGQVARIAAGARRPLLVVLDGPEEAPPELLARWRAWCGESVRRLRRVDGRLALGCLPEFWERMGPAFGPDDVHGCWSLGPLDAAAAAVLADRHGLGGLFPAVPTDPLRLRLLGELRIACPELALAEDGVPPTRAELLAARLDLACLRVAEVLDAGRTTGRRRRLAAVRRVAATVAGRCHEAARLMLSAPDGALTAADFDALFRWEGGWAQAVLDEGLLVPAGTGYRFALGAMAEWLQSAHLDLSSALGLVLADPGPSLVERSGPPDQPWARPGQPVESAQRVQPVRPVPPEAAGPAEREAFAGRRVGAHRRGGPRGWAPPVPRPGPPGPPRKPGVGASAPASAPARAAASTPGPDPRAADVTAAPGSTGGAVRGGAVARWRIGVLREALLGMAAGVDPSAVEVALARLVRRLDGPDAAATGSEPRWWAERLLTGTLERLPDAGPHRALLRSLAERLAVRTEAGPFVPWEFWERVPLSVEDRMDVLRLLARGPAPEPRALVGRLLAALPAIAFPALCRWLEDDRVAATAAGLLLDHRGSGLDDLAEALVEAAQPRADALLRELAEREPSALCRAIDRWAHDPRPERQVAAAFVLGSAHPKAEADRSLVRFAAEALLARPEAEALHGAALTALVRDPLSRPRHLRAALARYVAADPLLYADALAPALESDPVHVLPGYAARLREPGEEAAAVLRALAATPAAQARVAAARLVHEHLLRRPESALQVAGWLRARLAHGPGERETLRAFVCDLVAEQPEHVRRVFAGALRDAEGPLAVELRGLLETSWETPPGTSPEASPEAGVTSPMRSQHRAHGKV
ncbi:serine protease [Streptacidiphilus sp. MAP5-3]|uniref:serine protease n=1 Tax=unclassified Streptacidiphilus TaxID=2643834 RepID=UPI003510E67E